VIARTGALRSRPSVRHLVRAVLPWGLVSLLAAAGPAPATAGTEEPVFADLEGNAVRLSQRLRVLGIAADGRDQVAAVREAMSELDVGFEVWLWANANDMAHYGVGPRLPATLIVDGSGDVVRRFRGVVSEKQLRPELEPLLRAAGETAEGSGEAPDATGRAAGAR